MALTSPLGVRTFFPEASGVLPVAEAHRETGSPVLARKQGIKYGICGVAAFLHEFFQIAVTQGIGNVLPSNMAGGEFQLVNVIA